MTDRAGVGADRFIGLAVETLEVDTRVAPHTGPVEDVGHLGVKSVFARVVAEVDLYRVTNTNLEGVLALAHVHQRYPSFNCRGTN